MRILKLRATRTVLSSAAIAAAMSLGVSAQAAERTQAVTKTAATTTTTTTAAQQWSAWGGTVGVRWNRELASDLGMNLGAAIARQGGLSADQREMFSLRNSGTLDFDVRNGNLHSFTGGALQASGGYVIGAPGGASIDLNNFRLVPRIGGLPVLDIVAADGKSWFYVDRLMYELIDGKQRLAGHGAVQPVGVHEPRGHFHLRLGVAAGVGDLQCGGDHIALRHAAVAARGGAHELGAHGDGGHAQAGAHAGGDGHQLDRARHAGQHHVGQEAAGVIEVAHAGQRIGRVGRRQAVGQRRGQARRALCHHGPAHGGADGGQRV